MAIKRGVKQWDPLSPNLFNNLLQWMFSNLDYEHRDVEIDAIGLNNLRFADDIVLFAENHDHLQARLNDLNIQSMK